MAATPRRHISNPQKPIVFKNPPNLEIHMLSATRIDGHSIHVVMSAPIPAGISSSDFFFAEQGNGVLWVGNTDTISGGPFSEFDISFSVEQGPENACNNSGFLICNIDGNYATDRGVMLRQPDVVAYAGL